MTKITRETWAEIQAQRKKEQEEWVKHNPTTIPTVQEFKNPCYIIFEQHSEWNYYNPEEGSVEEITSKPVGVYLNHEQALEYIKTYGEDNYTIKTVELLP